VLNDSNRVQRICLTVLCCPLLIAKHANSEPEGGCQVTPLLADLRAGNLVGNLEALTRSAAEAAEDIHRLQSEVRFTGLY